MVWRSASAIEIFRVNLDNIGGDKDDAEIPSIVMCTSRVPHVVSKTEQTTQ